MYQKRTVAVQNWTGHCKKFSTVIAEVRSNLYKGHSTVVVHMLTACGY